jgi:long-subunit fatty acid transport protein
MYRRMSHKAGQTKRFTITDAGSLGWEVREEQNSQIVWSIRYTDWHRVERARMTFAREAAVLANSGWQES